jgi:hypothetical protein
MTYPIHPACAAWPEMSDKELQELAADIKEHGQLESATITPDGELLDGRNRQDACAINGTELATVVYDGDPVAYSLSKNKYRRHMNKTALAFVCAEMAKLPRGGDRGNQYTGGKVVNTTLPPDIDTIGDIAKTAGIGRADVANAKAIMDKGTADVVDLAKSRKIGLRAAADYVRHTPKQSQVADPDLIKSRRGRPPSVKRDEVRPTIRNLLERGAPIEREALMAQLGVSAQPLIVAEAYERGRLEGIAEVGGFPDSPLAVRQQQALERKVKELEAQFDLTVARELQKRMRARDAEDALAIQQARAVLELNTGRFRPPLNPQEYTTVLWALHPDSQSETKTAEAFIIMRRKKLVLCDAGPIARKSPPLPDVPVRKTARR